jgi:thiamine-phosphate pyrophosphorylase
MLFNKKLKFFFFNKIINNKKNLLRFKNISYICIWDAENDIDQIKIDRKFCKENNIKFYLSNNISLAKILKADGVHIPSSFKGKIHNINSNMDIIGTAHCYNDCYTKIQQGCKGIFISPLFNNKKYSVNKILGPLKFTNFSKVCKTEVYALAGIRTNNIKTLNLLKIDGMGGISFFDKIKPASISRGEFL